MQVNFGQRKCACEREKETMQEQRMEQKSAAIYGRCNLSMKLEKEPKPHRIRQYNTYRYGEMLIISVEIAAHN